MQFVQNILLKLYSKLYPTEQDRLDAAKEIIKDGFRRESCDFKREIKLALGETAAIASTKHTRVEVIEMVKDVAKKLAEIETSRNNAAAQVDVSPDEVFSEIKDIPKLEDHLSTLKGLLEQGNERKRQLVDSQKESCKRNIEDYQKRIEEEQKKLEQLNEERVAVAKEEAEVKQIIRNQEEK